MSKNVLSLPLCLAVAGTGLSSCSQQPDAPKVDPLLGRQCFEFHLPQLPPGSQYEGFEASADRINVRVMTGVDMKTVTCVLGPDRTLDLEKTTKK
jgi:hypothetical protein